MQRALLPIVLFGFLLGMMTACENSPVAKSKPDFCPAEYEQQQLSIKAQKAAKDLKIHWIDSLMNKWYTSHRFNGTILVAEKGEVLYRGALGYGNLQTKDTLTLSSPFQLASASKPITALSILTLYEKGLLDLDAPVTTYIPELPYNTVTIRHLLTHRSGLPRYMSLGHVHWEDKSMALSNCNMVDLYIKNKPGLEFTPGSRFIYNNTNYAMLAAVVEAVSGQDFGDYVHDAIFAPLGMNNSFIYSKCKQEEIPQTVLGYVRGGKGRYGEVGNDYLNGVTGDKGAYSTVEDLFKLDQALYDETLLKQSTLDEAFTPYGHIPKRHHDDYGLGWRIDKYRPNIVYHTGWWKGFRTMFIRKLDTRHTVIALNNRENMLPYKLCWQIIEQLNNMPEVAPMYDSLDGADKGDEMGGGVGR